MIKSTIQRPTEGFTGNEIITAFRTALEKSPSYTESDIESLANIFAKTPTDNFVVYDSEDLKRPIDQGDILLSHESSSFYQKVFPSVRLGEPAKDTVLQEQDGGGITGDHRIVGINGTELSIINATYVPLDNVTEGRSMNCKIIDAKAPFVLTHREHGNIAFPAGKYLARTQINAKDLTIMLD